MEKMQISWNDVSRTEKAGVHFVARLGIDVFVRERHIEISTTFGKIYPLGAFKPAENSGPG